jgi:hypothetical protein
MTGNAAIWNRGGKLPGGGWVKGFVEEWGDMLLKGVNFGVLKEGLRTCLQIPTSMPARLKQLRWLPNVWLVRHKAFSPTQPVENNYYSPIA